MTDRKTYRAKIFEKMAHDPDRVRRQAMHRCRRCYYNPVVGGAALTPYICPVCHLERVSAITVVPALCESCADAQGVCRCCGQALD